MKKTVRLLSIMAVIVAGCTTACGQNAIKIQRMIQEK